MNKNETNPLILLWNTLGTIGGIISIASMLQKWNEDLVKWKGFILTIIETYQQIIRPIFEFLSAFLPFNIPPFFQDYLVFGCIIAVSEFRAMRKREKSKLYIHLLKLLFWPFVLAVIIYTYPEYIRKYLSRQKRPTFVQHNLEIQRTVNTSIWLLTVILGTSILLSINMVIK